MSTAVAEALARLPDLTAAHIVLTLTALGVGGAISLPLGILAAENRYARRLAVTSAAIVQTIPGIALLALMVPVYGGKIGFAPALTALILYSVLPILRNTLVGLAGIDPGVREAARALGMTRVQQLMQVELPLAAPVIVAGARTSAVLVVSAATLATPVGGTSLGDLIFAGLQTRTWGVVVVGCVAAAALAIVIDQILRLTERAVAVGDRLAGILAGIGALALALAALMPALSIGGAGSGAAPARATFQAEAGILGARPVRIGAKTFTEQFILARLIGRRIEAAGGEVEIVENLGSAIAFDALANGEVDVFVDYSGTLWANVLRREELASRAVVNAELAAALWRSYDVVMLGGLGFENAYAFGVRAEDARARSLETIDDLAASAGELTIGSDYEFFGRPEWISTREAYGLEAMNIRSMDSAFMYDALKNGEVDVITAFTTDGRIDAFDIALLSDPRGALPPYDALLLLSAEAGGDVALTGVLSPLLNHISPELMRGANRRVDLDRATPTEAAIWLDEQLRN